MTRYALILLAVLAGCGETKKPATKPLNDFVENSFTVTHTLSGREAAQAFIDYIEKTRGIDIPDGSGTYDIEKVDGANAYTFKITPSNPSSDLAPKGGE